MTQFLHPPITEAAIEIRLSEPLDASLVDQLNVKLSKDYQYSNRKTEMRIGLDVAERQATFDEEDHGYNLENSDHTDVLMIMPDRMVCSRMSPYEGWDEFRKRASNCWKK